MKQFRKLWFYVRLGALSLATALRFLFLYPLSLGAGLFSGRSDNSDYNHPLILYSQVPWWGVWQRPQEEAMGLSEFHHVMYVSPIQVHERLRRYSRYQPYVEISRGKGVEVFSPLIFSGNYKWGFIHSLNRILIAAELRWFLRKEREVLFFTNSPFVDYLYENLPVKGMYYDIIDDFASFEWAPPGSAEMEKNIIEKADAVITGTRYLRDSKKALAPSATFIPCGVNFSRFYLPEEKRPGKEPPELKGLPRPIIGYIGTLSERIDTGILNGLAEKHPDASIVLIGPVHRKLGALEEKKNIHLLGLKKHEELPDFLHHFKVALLPFRLTKAAMAINPVKTLEYLAAGCVVVSTAIPDVVRFYSDIVIIASSPEDFIEKVGDILHTPNEDLIRKGVEKAENSTWEDMVRRIQDKIRETV